MLFSMLDTPFLLTVFTSSELLFIFFWASDVILETKLLYRLSALALHSFRQIS